MGRRRILTGQVAVVPNTNLFTFSWGPFGVPMTIWSLRCKTSDTLVTRSTVGLYVSADSGFVTGAVPAKSLTPTGWTRITEPSFHAAGNDDDLRARDNPFQTAAGEAIIIDNIGVVVFGNPLYIKLLIWNPTAVAFSANAFLIIEETPDADPLTAIAVRPQPGQLPATPEQVPPPPAPPPAPAAPAPPPPATPPPPIVVGTASPTLPPAAQMPAFTIDPTDPDESARQAVR
jgi:hypothetical protein